MYKIITDQGADIPKEMFTDNLIKIPLAISIYDREINFDIYNDEQMCALYKYLGHGGNAYSRAQTKQEAVDIIDKQLQHGSDILIITSSPYISATANQILLAVEELRPKYKNQTIEVVNSLSASVGEGQLVSVAQRSNGNVHEVAMKIANLTDRVRYFICLKDKTSFQAGGRLSGTDKFDEENYNVLYLPKDGLYKIYNVFSSFHTFEESICELIIEDSPIYDNVVFVGHGSNIVQAERLCEMIEAKTGARAFKVYANAVSAVHTGDNFIQIGYIAKS